MMDGSFLRMMLGTYSALGTLDEINYEKKPKQNMTANTRSIGGIGCALSC